MNTIVHLILLATLASMVSAAVHRSVRICGKDLSEVMSRICLAYYSPYDDDSEILSSSNRLRRGYSSGGGIADECCDGNGCTWLELTSYCAEGTRIESTEGLLWEHLIQGRSVDSIEAERESEKRSEAEGAAAAPVPAALEAGGDALGFRAEWARSEGRVSVVARAAPVLGTVSPLLTWGPTLHADLSDQERVAFVTV